MVTPLQKQLKEKDRQIDLLHSISRITSSTPDLMDLLKKFCDLISKELQPDSTLIYLLDSKTDELVLSGSHNPHPKQLGRIKLKVGEGITGWVAEKKKSVALAKEASEDARFKAFNNLKEDTYEAFLSVPILLKNELVGVLNVQHRKAHKHSPVEIDLAESIAEEIAGAIDHARVYSQAVNKNKQIEALSRMSESIIQGAYLREILQLIVSMTAEMLGSKVCSLMLLDDKKKELRIEATQSLSESYRTKPPIRVDSSVSGRAVLEKRPITVLDVTKDPQYSYPDIAKKDNLKSLVVIPMMTKEKVIGVVNCYTSDLHTFTEDEIQLLQAVANQAAIAIEHTRALEEKIAAQEALETRKVIERAKGILMRMQGLNEESSFKLIQRQAMDRRKSMKEIAEAIILSEDIQKNR